MTDTDRTVHARSADGRVEIVRYDKAGRWYQENRFIPRIRLNLASAVKTALGLVDEGGHIILGQPGGQQFDAKVRGAREKAARHR